MNFKGKIVSKINRIFLIARCLARAFLKGPANKTPETISRIIVIPAGKLGDVVCCTPVMRAIRTHLPKVHIIVAGNAKMHSLLLADSGLADEYLELQGGEVEERIRNIKSCRADAGIVTGPSFDSAALLYIAGVPLVIGPTAVGGVAHDMTRPYKILQRLIKTFPHVLKDYAPRERLKALEPLGIFSDDTKKHLGFSKEAGKKAADLILKIPDPYKYLVGISAGAGNKEKQWGPKKFAEVANYLIQEHRAHIVVFGSKGDVPEVTEMLNEISDKSQVTNVTHISIDDLKATISMLDVFISVNTGPLYIAESFNIPTVDILGPVNPWDQPPQGKIHKMVFPPGKPEPLLKIMNTRNHDVKEAERIAESTRLEDVVTATLEALREVDEIRLTKKG